MKDKTVYIVSGYMRTGTSMMMRALEEGGMKAINKQSRDKMKNRYKDEHYDPNIGGLYELEINDYLKFDFPKKYKGKLIKMLWGGVANFAPMSSVRIVFMLRDEEEIRQSFDAFFGRQITKIKNI